VHALDFTMEALRITTCSSPAIQPMCGDTLHLPFADGTYDAVFSQGLLEHFSDPLSIVREQSRVVKPGGVLLIDVPQRYSIYTVQKHAKMRQGTWFAEWETEFSLAQLTSLIVAVGLIPARSYGRGYYPAPLLGVRNLHTLDQRRQMPVHLPNAVRKTIERVWQHLEANTWYFRWMMNIGVIGRKPL
jgi:SAM-dependent methyltransferase